MSSETGISRKLQSADGRIKIATLSGVSVLVAVIALLVGVLPAFATDGGTPSGEGVQPHVIDFGGGSGGCAFVDSAAGNELHVNNPTPNATTTYSGPDDTQITLTVNADDTMFTFTVDTPGIAVYDVTVNGGSKSNHYDYDGSTVGAADSDTGLHAPPKSGGSANFFNLSHVNICYDVQTVDFQCDTEVSAILLNQGLFTEATTTIFTNSVDEDGVCTPKEGTFLIDNTDDEISDPNLKLEFNGDGTDTVYGRLDVTKVFVDGDNDGNPDFEALEYSEIEDPAAAVDLDWCSLRAKAAGDGDQFDTVLDPNDDLAPADTLYPSTEGATALSDGNVACKVAEFEDATGTQVTVVYFEFEDPHFY